MNGRAVAIGIVVAGVLGCGAGVEIADPAVHAAVHELQLKIDECGEGERGPCEGTSALEVVAWTVENEDRLDATGLSSENTLVISFPGGSVLVTEHDEETGRLLAWTIR